MASILQCCPFLTRDPTSILCKLRPLLTSSARRCPVMVARSLTRSVADLQLGKETSGDLGEKWMELSDKNSGYDIHPRKKYVDAPPHR